MMTWKYVGVIFFGMTSVMSSTIWAGQTPILSIITPNPKQMGHFTSKVVLDSDSGTDRIDLINQQGQVVCSYATSQEKGEALKSIDPVALKGFPNRFFLVQGEVGATGSDVAILMDTAAPKGQCTHVLESYVVKFYSRGDSFAFTVQYEIEPHYPTQKTTVCRLNASNALACSDETSKASH